MILYKVAIEMLAENGSKSVEFVYTMATSFTDAETQVTQYLKKFTDSNAKCSIVDIRTFAVPEDNVWIEAKYAHLQSIGVPSYQTIKEVP